MTTAKKSLASESKTESSTTHQSLPISKHSLVQDVQSYIKELQMSLQQDFPVNHSQLPVRTKGKQTKETCGLKPSDAFSWYDHDTHSWKTYQGCLLTNTYDIFTGTWPKQGMMQDGVCWEQTIVVQTTEENGGGHLPTPCEADATVGGIFGKHDTYRITKTGTLRRINKQQKDGSVNLARLVRIYPTPQADDAKNVNPKENRRMTLTKSIGGGTLNPNWVEWLMGWPIGWTDLKPLAMDKFQSWLRQFGSY
jgi:hypothetical protein